MPHWSRHLQHPHTNDFTIRIEDAEKAHPDGPSTQIYELIGQLQANVQGGQNLRLFARTHETR